MSLNEDLEDKFRVDDSDPSEELLEWAKENINEDPDMKYQHVSELLDMIYERGECSPHRTDEEFLLRFLRARHFIVRKAHRLMVNYYKFREANPEYFTDVDVYSLRELSRTRLFQVPPYTDQFGRRMIIFRPAEWNQENHSITQFFQLLICMSELGVIEPATQLKGIIAIVDLSDISLNLAWYLTPSVIKNMISILITSFPVRIEAVHFLYTSWAFDMAWSMAKNVLPEVAVERVFFHGDQIENLQTYVDPKYLPMAYGGTRQDFMAIEWVEKVLLKNEKCLKVAEELGHTNVRALAKELEEDSRKKMVEEQAK